MIETNTIYNEPCLETLSRMPDNYLDCVITSPPYWQLRDYGYVGQWGLEPTYEEYLANLWSMLNEIHRVLKPTGTVWINLGDTYGTQPGKHDSYNRSGLNRVNSTLTPEQNAINLEVVAEIIRNNQMRSVGLTLTNDLLTNE